MKHCQLTQKVSNIWQKDFTKSLVISGHLRFLRAYPGPGAPVQGWHMTNHVRIAQQRELHGFGSLVERIRTIEICWAEFAGVDGVRPRLHPQAHDRKREGFDKQDGRRSSPALQTRVNHPYGTLGGIDMLSSDTIINHDNVHSLSLVILQHCLPLRVQLRPWSVLIEHFQSQWAALETG